MVSRYVSGHIKGYPFEVVVSHAPPGVVLSDQIKSIDWKAREAKKKGFVPTAVIDEVRAKVSALLGL
jgi:mRNA interferase MazF